MELKKKNIHMEHMKNKISSQVNLEGDHNISERNLDAFRVIQKKACIKIEDIKIYDESVYLKASLCYEILYLTEDQMKKVCCASGEIPFEQNIHTESIKKSVIPRVETDLENLTVRLVNSRKFGIHAIVGIVVFLDELLEEEVVLDVENCNGIEMKKCDCEFASMVLSTKDILKLKEEFEIPEGYSNIGKIMWKDIQLLDLSFTPMDGKIQIQGMMYGFFLYEPEEETEQLQCLELSKAVTTFIELSECEENAKIWMKDYSKHLLVETRPDFDGEERLLYIELAMDLSIKIFKNIKCSLLCDAYSYKNKIQPLEKVIESKRILKTISGQARVEDLCSRASNIVKILHTEATISSTNYEMGGDSVGIRGIVHIELLCETDDTKNLYTCVIKEMPFEIKENVGTQQLDETILGMTGIVQIHSSLEEAGIHCHILIGYKIIVSEKIKRKIVSEIMEKDIDESKKTPAIAVVFAKEGETVWEMGKKYQVPILSIMERNELINDELKTGQKIIVCKETDE